MPTWEKKIWDSLNGSYSPSRGALKVVHDVESPFGEFLVTERTPVIELNSSYGTSLLRDKITTTNGGTITSAESEAILSTGTSANSTAILDSAEVGRYIPGYAAQIGIGVRTAQSVELTGSQELKWGGFSYDDQNGLYFGKNTQGIFVAILRQGTEVERVYQEDWNRDKLDGSGDPATNQSGFDINTDFGIIYQINFTWYGYGEIFFNVTASSDGSQVPILCHAFRDFSATSIVSPNLKVSARAENGPDSTSNIDLFVGGRQYSIFGRYDPKYRFTGDFRLDTDTSTTPVPLVSFRRKSDFGDRSIKLQGYDLLAVDQACIIEVRVDPTLTGADFGTPTNHLDTETALESDTSATAGTGGFVVWQALVPGSSGQGNAVISNLLSAKVDFDLPGDSTVSLFARTLSGTGLINAEFRLREEW